MQWVNQDYKVTLLTQKKNGQTSCLQTLHAKHKTAILQPIRQFATHPIICVYAAWESLCRDGVCNNLSMILHSEVCREVCNLPVEAVGGHSLVNEMPLPSKVKWAVQLRERERERDMVVKSLSLKSVCSVHPERQDGRFFSSSLHFLWLNPISQCDLDFIIATESLNQWGEMVYETQDGP